MTTRTLVGCLSIIALSVTFLQQAQAQRPLPKVDVKDMSGKSIDLSTQKNEGKPLILFAWEISCQPCITEFNAISKLYKDWKTETGVRIIAVSVDESRNSMRVPSFVRSKGWDFDFFLDPTQAFKRAMNVTQCPYVYVLDQKGEVAWQKASYTPGDEYVIYDVVKKISKGEKIN
jgi:cytochrome c biogenesis protein CcmG, thiol:disulfide interchange protein DsbE